jgi:hypothetical protein
MMAGLISGVALAVQEPIAKTFVVKALAACISVAPVLDRFVVGHDNQILN